ncbi:hypothetical protein J3R82DRAFT_2582 [Butyriboletus roseoflavus]|nr:hypothetical protein J3R82DRAFT_2582 [Butyriboletus roseoflavus]
MATTVHIYLHSQLEGASTGTTEHWIRALSIPREDIKRFTLYPLKWVRFATFTVCGAKGDLSATPGGEIVEYDNVSFEILEHKYYYTPNDTYHLTDYQAFNDEITSSVATPRRTKFREDIRRRDNSCVVTGEGPEYCDATHIIPNSKGSNYIIYVVRDCSSLYEQLPFSLDDDVDINCIENGILLRKDLHQKFGMAAIGFLKTPNFAMLPTDVPWIEEGPIPHSRATLQYHIEPHAGRGSLQQWDIRADWSRDKLPPPPSILLDFMYGAAVVKRWGCNPLGDVLRKRFEDDFSKVLPESPKHSTPEDDESKVESDSDDLENDDSDWGPWKGKQKGRKTCSSDASAGLLEAMDTVLYLSMMVKGTTPQLLAAEWEKQNKEKEQRSQEHSCEKVQQWLNSDATVSGFKCLFPE